MPIKIFIAGTDTNVGKTYASTCLLNYFHTQGLETIAIKPIATGCVAINNKLYNDDALSLQKTSSIKLDYDLINPFTFEPAIAPNIASNNSISVDMLNQKCRAALEHPADVHLIEGVGGWHVPLNLHETMADFAVTNQYNVIMVVGIKLGCINHALLTARVMQQDGANVIGWIANEVELGTMCFEENIETLRIRLEMPLLRIIRHRESPTFPSLTSKLSSIKSI